MDDIDKKLESLFYENDAGLENEGIESFDYEQMAKDVKQAFIDAGWREPTPLTATEVAVNEAYKKYREVREVKVPEIKWPPKSVMPLLEAYAKYKEAGGPDDWIIMSRESMETNARLSGLMTGQEWYSKFMVLAPRQLTEADELDFNLHDDDPEGNCYYAYNCALADMRRAAKKAAGIE